MHTLLSRSSAQARDGSVVQMPTLTTGCLGGQDDANNKAVKSNIILHPIHTALTRRALPAHMLVQRVGTGGHCTHTQPP